jgi:myosin heavy subunit
MDGPDNLAALSTLDENSLLDNIRKRYNKDIIYTYIGDILVALNPYKRILIYGPEYEEKYTDVKIRSALSPHLFAISDTSYQNLRRTGCNQCCVVSGESGAGKTETTKLMVQHIVHLCKSRQGRLHERIVQVNPLLEAFGNAQTVMNNNSSRFGKYIELIFSHGGEILGAHISEYLLEKSRVVSHGTGERNFHIFYYMFAGLHPDQLRNNLLDRPEQHRFVNNLLDQ